MSAVADEDGILRNQTVLEQNRRARSTDGDQICMLSLNILMQGFKTAGRRTIARARRHSRAQYPRTPRASSECACRTGQLSIDLRATPAVEALGVLEMARDLCSSSQFDHPGAHDTIDLAQDQDGVHFERIAMHGSSRPDGEAAAGA